MIQRDNFLRLLARAAEAMEDAAQFPAYGRMISSVSSHASR